MKEYRSIKLIDDKLNLLYFALGQFTHFLPYFVELILSLEVVALLRQLVAQPIVDLHQLVDPLLELLPLLLPA